MQPASPPFALSLPYSAEAEKAVLGAILQDPGQLMTLENLLQPDHFFLDQHRLIYRALLALSAQGLPMDVLTTSDMLRRQDYGGGQVDHVYLVDLLTSVPLTQNFTYYADIVRRDSFTRRIIRTCQGVVEKATTAAGSLETYIEEVEKEILQVSGSYDRKGIALADTLLDQMIEEIQQQIEHEGKLTGIPTGLHELDNLTGGLQRTDFILIGARPAMGKTALALNMALHAALKGYSTVVFSLEMGGVQLMKRLTSIVAQISASNLRKGTLSDTDLDCMMEGVRRLHAVHKHIGIDATHGITLSELRSRCRRHKKEFGLDVIFIDYLQLMSGSSERKNQNREQEVAEISKGLKMLAKELQIPVIALTQLNRGPEQRQGADKRPRMSDLRESGSIEQDADMVLLVYRDEYYFPDSELKGIAELIVGKNRHGASGQSIKLGFQPSFMAFQNLMSRND